MNWKRLFLTMSLSALCVVFNALSVDAQTCDPNLTYPNNPPGPEGGCGDYEDCNENGAFDIGEPCHEHHDDDGEHHDAEDAGHLDDHGEPGDHGDGEHHDGRYCRICDISFDTKEEMDAHAEDAGHLDDHGEHHDEDGEHHDEDGEHHDEDGEHHDEDD